MRCTALLVSALVVLAGGETASAQSDTILLNGNVVTEVGVQRNAWLTIAGGKITSISSTRPAVQTSLVLTSSDYIFPGFVDLHDHPSYNAFPRWKPPHFYNNRYEWRYHEPDYDKALATPERALMGTDFCDDHAYVGVKALIGGTTAFMGTSAPVYGKPMPSCVAGPVRNLDWDISFYGVGITQLPTMNALGITQCPNDPSARPCDMRPDALVKAQAFVADPNTKLLAIHIAEGKKSDAQSQTEFPLLEASGLLTAKTAVIHGVALGAPEFKKMKNAGASLVWSPRSNIELYGETTDIATAVQEGVTIALAPDWSPTGSTNTLAELKYANAYIAAQKPGLLSPQRLFAMATAEPARIGGISDKVGSIAPGLFADLFVLRARTADPFVDLVNASPQDITLVLSGGVPMYGVNTNLVQLGVASVEGLSVCGEHRGLNSAAVAPKTFADVTTDLTNAIIAAKGAIGPLVECP